MLIEYILRKLFRFENSRFESIRNINKNQICYLLGNGPSIKNYDLLNFSDHILIGCNWLVFHKDIDKVNCKYMLNISPHYSSIILARLHNFFHSKSSKISINLINSYRERTDRLGIKRIEHILASLNKKSNSHPYFVSGQSSFKFLEKELLQKGVKPRHLKIDGSLRFQIIFAYMLGFKKAILVGHDHLNQFVSLGHWYEGYPEKQERNTLNDWNNDFLREFSKLIELVVISNNDLRFNFLEKISYEEFTNEAIISKTNLDLIEKDFQEVLSEGPNYFIK